MDYRLGIRNTDSARQMWEMRESQAAQAKGI